MSVAEPDAPPASGSRPPRLTVDRLLLVITGAASAGFSAFWINWLRSSYPDLELKVAVTRSGERFVTAQTLGLLSGRPVVRDEWPDTADPQATHVVLAEWAQAVAVYPASAHFLARLALGLADTPVMLALHCTEAVIGVAPSVPPGMLTNPVYQRHVTSLDARPNVTVAPTRVGRSATTGRSGDGVATPLWTLLARMESLHVAPTTESEVAG